MDLTPLCTKFKISKKDLRSKKRTRDIALKRQLIAYTLRIEHGLSFGEIGNLLNVDHSSAVYYLREVKKLIELLKLTGEDTFSG
jgi:chromosomal replication initiation ATPase DnaA